MLPHDHFSLSCTHDFYFLLHIQLQQIMNLSEELLPEPLFRLSANTLTPLGL